jgi:hypothetical protein
MTDQRSTGTRLDGLEQDVIVVDGFYQDPDAVRALALAQEFAGPDPRSDSPGLESRRALFSNTHLERFAALTGRPLVSDPSRWVFGKFRISHRGDTMRTGVHIDGMDWTAVVYLSNSESATGGLGFFRHRELGLDQVPGPEGLSRYGCVDLTEFDARYVLPVSCQPESWEEIGHVDIAYNRLVLFRGGRLFHGISELFGTGIDDGRLTQNFFMHEKDSVDAAVIHGSPTVLAES